MNYQNTTFFISVSMIMILYFVKGHLSQSDIEHKYINQYGSGYGTEWIYFPDGDGVLHYVNLTATESMPYLREKMISEIEYKLYTRNSSNNYIVLDEFGKPLNATEDLDDVLSNAPLKLITHGWRSSVEKNLIDIRNAYIKTRDVNVISVDWSYTASSIFYHWVANQTFTIGTEIGQFLKSLTENYNISGNQIHLIGHSLGAHVMGVAASNSNVTINRITGLDPAKPLFEFPNRENSTKLDSSDAEFVDVIHTCGGFYGIEAPIGTADFYPNNGLPPQPGCSSLQMIIEACSHIRALHYFAESIRTPTAFPAYECKGWTDYLDGRCYQMKSFMGEGANRNMSGKFYLKTNSIKPFGFGLF